MPRPVRARAFKARLHPDVLHFLETGETRAQPGTDEGFLCWLVVSRQPEGLALWREHRAHVLAAWREAGRPGVPWAEAQLGEVA